MHFIKTLFCTGISLAAAMPSLETRHPTCGTVLNELSKSKDPYQVLYLGDGECLRLSDKNAAESYWSKNGCTCSLYKSKDCSGEPVAHGVGPKQSPIFDIHSYACIVTVGGLLDQDHE